MYIASRKEYGGMTLLLENSFLRQMYPCIYAGILLYIRSIDVAAKPISDKAVLMCVNKWLLKLKMAMIV